MTVPTATVVALARRHTLYDMLRRTVQRQTDKVALTCGDTSWSYHDLDQMVERVAGGLLNVGISEGDRVALLSRNSHWFVALRFAAARIGAVLVPVNFMLSPDEAAFILSHSAARALFVDEACAPAGIAAARIANLSTIIGIPGDNTDEPDEIETKLSELMSAAVGVLPALRIKGESIAQILYTSGTESRPKGAMLSHDAILTEYQGCVVECDWRTDAVVIHALPLFHCAQLDGFLGPSLQVGATNIVLSGATPELLIPAIKKYQATSLFAPPTVWISLLRSALFESSMLGSLTHGYYGASIMPLEVLRELRERLPSMRLWNCYGQTEATCIAAVLQPEDQVRKAGAAGRPIGTVETRIVDDDMQDVAAGQIGEIVHRSPQLLSAYWQDEARTAEAFAGGWFHSGDLATIDDEGFITIVDRKKDIIKSGGENVSSREVEEAIYTLAAVSEVAVVGVPHDRWIEMVTAFVVPKPGLSIEPSDVIEHCRANLSRFKVPKQVSIVDTLPRNASGKILKRELRANLKGIEP